MTPEELDKALWRKLGSGNKYIHASMASLYKQLIEDLEIENEQQPS